MTVASQPKLSTSPKDLAVERVLQSLVKWLESFHSHCVTELHNLHDGFVLAIALAQVDAAAFATAIDDLSPLHLGSWVVKVPSALHDLKWLFAPSFLNSPTRLGNGKRPEFLFGEIALSTSKQRM